MRNIQDKFNIQQDKIRKKKKIKKIIFLLKNKKKKRENIEKFQTTLSEFQDKIQFLTT